VSDTSYLSSEEMSFLSRERRIAVDRGIQISGTDVLNLSCSNDVLRCSIWKLDPVLKKVIIDPIHKLVDAFSTFFVRPM
jgi:hypothetical protein